MKYSELISFQPIESTIQLTESGDKETAKKLVQTYVMSDSMAETMKAPVLEQLQMDEVVDNKGVLIVGNYGTGKSHLMSVISSVATDAENLQYLQNQNFAKEMECVAGKFEVLRIEIGGVTMPLREILFGFIQEDFQKRSIPFEMPDWANVKDNKKVIKDVMMNFEEKCTDKGYLIVVDEFLSYLTSRNELQIVLDLEFLRALGEMCSKSKLRVVLGVQEKIFDNPKFSFVAATMKKVSDRFTQLIITKEATSYVVSERILKKTAEQKALIRDHLEKFSGLYTGMSSRMEEFVDLYPIHPSYIDVFNKISVIETRHILKDISTTIRSVFDEDVPEDAPGIYSFDSCWTSIKNNGMFKSDPMISRVVNASTQLEEIIDRSFPKPPYKPLAKKIIYALSVHRLTTGSLDVQFGLTAENLKDDLCLYLPLPEQEAEFLLGLVTTTLKDIMTTVSGQFIIHNEANNQYYIDVDKVVDYDEKIKQKASFLADSELNRSFYDVVYFCLEWDKKEYITNFKIYEYDLNWDSHNMFREGYLFMGLPGERSTAQPERDFYIHIMPPYDSFAESIQNLKDEVYLYFKSTDDFKEQLGLYAAAQSLAAISEGKDKEAYQQKGQMIRKKLIKHLSDNKNTCFDLLYQKNKKQLIEVLKGRYRQDLTFKDTIDLAASLIFDDYFCEKYPEYPVMKTKITRKNIADNTRQAFDYFAGRKSQLSTAMLQSFDILEGDKIKPENSQYARYYIDKVKALPPQGVLNYSDLFDLRYLDIYVDKKFQIEYVFTPIIFLSLVYAGYAVITTKNGRTITAATLDSVPGMLVSDLYEFKYLSKPAQASMAEIKKLYEVIGLNPAELDDIKHQDDAIAKLLDKAKELCNMAVIQKQKLTNGFELWEEPLANNSQISNMEKACEAIRDEFSNYSAKYNTFAKLNNFNLSMEQIDTIEKQIKLILAIREYVDFKTGCVDTVNYIANIEHIELGAEFKSQIENAKASFREIRDKIIDGESGEASARKVEDALSKIKDKYIEMYMAEHDKKRLGVKDAKRRGLLQEGAALCNLKKLRTIDILSTAKLGEIETDLAGLKICYDLKKEDLKQHHMCKCGFSLDDQTKNVFGQLDNIENRIDSTLEEWAKTLLDTISDPLVAGSKEYLSADQKKVVEDFISTKEFPEKVDDFFVKAISQLLQGFEPVVIDADEIVKNLEILPPMDEDGFVKKLKEMLSRYTKGKDASKLRIVVKRKDNQH